MSLGKRGLGILIAELWGLVFTPASGGLICTSSRLRKMLALVVTAFVVCFFSPNCNLFIFYLICFHRYWNKDNRSFL